MARNRRANGARGYALVALAPHVRDTRRDETRGAWLLLVVCACAAFWAVVIGAVILVQSG